MLPPWMVTGASLGGSHCCLVKSSTKEGLAVPTLHALCTVRQRKDGRHDRCDCSKGRRRMVNFFVYSIAKAHVLFTNKLQSMYTRYYAEGLE